MTQKELTCRGLEVWRHGVRRHVGRTEYYRTTPANSSPKFCWLNGKAPQGQHYGGTDVHFQNVGTRPISSELGNRHKHLYTEPAARSMVAFRTCHLQPGRRRQSRTHGCCVPWLAVPTDNLRSASWYSPSRARSRPEIPLLWFICSKTATPFGSLRLTRASPAAVAKL